MRCFMVPWGFMVLVGGIVMVDVWLFIMMVEVGLEVYGVLFNWYLVEYMRVWCSVDTRWLWFAIVVCFLVVLLFWLG